MKEYKIKKRPKSFIGLLFSFLLIYLWLELEEIWNLGTGTTFLIVFFGFPFGLFVLYVLFAVYIDSEKREIHFIKLEEISEFDKKQLESSGFPSGVRIKHIESESLKEIGLKEGMIITTLISFKGAFFNYGEQVGDRFYHQIKSVSQLQSLLNYNKNEVFFLIAGSTSNKSFFEYRIDYLKIKNIK